MYENDVALKGKVMRLEDETTKRTTTKWRTRE